MFFDRSVQRIRVGASNSVSSNSRLVVIPESLTVLAYTVPGPAGPSVVLRISRTRGLNFGSFSPSARNRNTSSIGRSITVVALNSPAMSPPLSALRGFRVCRLAVGGLGTSVRHALHRLEDERSDHD